MGEIDRKIENFVLPEFMEAFDIQNRNGIEKLYSEHGMKCEIKSMKNEDSLVLLMNYPFGITPSGYTSAAYIFEGDFESLIDSIENYYSYFDYKRVLCFVDEDRHQLLKRKGFEMIKPLQQIFYFIYENRKWRRKYRELL